MIGTARIASALTHPPATAAVCHPRVRVASVARVGFVDASRALAVIGMLAANLVNVCLRDVPAVLAHNQGDALRAFDFPAPVFQFLVGVSLPLSLAACRRREGADGARWSAARRFVHLVLLGMVLDGIGALSPWPRWGVLQTLGLGGLVATLLADAPAWRIAVAGLGLLVSFSGPANGVVHAGPLAALAFVPLTLAGLLVGRCVAGDAAPAATARAAGRLALVALPLAAAGWLAGVPVNKVLGTSTFVALATAVAAGLVAASALYEAAGACFPAWLLLVGRHALTAWVLLHVAVYYPAWLVFPAWERLALPEGLAAAAALTAALCFTTIALGRRGIDVRV